MKRTDFIKSVVLGCVSLPFVSFSKPSKIGVDIKDRVALDNLVTELSETSKKAKDLAIEYRTFPLVNRINSYFLQSNNRLLIKNVFRTPADIINDKIYHSQSIFVVAEDAYEAMEKSGYNYFYVIAKYDGRYLVRGANII